MSAAVLPDPEIDGPEAARAIEEAKAEAFGHLPDHNESTVALIETPSELDELNARDARRQAKQAEAAREREAPAAAQQPTNTGADRGESRSDSNAPIQYRADAQAARDQLELLSTLTALQRDEQQRPPASTASDAEDEEVAFFRNPKDAVARAVASHPALAALQTAARQTFERKTSAELRKDFPDVERTVASPEFQKWVSASPIRMQLLRAAHEGWDLDAARHLFSTWNAVRGGDEAGAKPGAKASAGKARVYRRSDVIRLMTERPDEYERLEPEISRAYAAGFVK